MLVCWCVIEGRACFTFLTKGIKNSWMMLCQKYTCIKLCLNCALKFVCVIQTLSVYIEFVFWLSVEISDSVRQTRIVIRMSVCVCKLGDWLLCCFGVGWGAGADPVLPSLSDRRYSWCWARRALVSVETSISQAVSVPLLELESVQGGQLSG